MLHLARQLALLTDSETQAVIWIVVGIIIIEGIWLAYLTFMMWRRHKKEAATKPGKAAPKPEETEEKE